MPIQAELNVAFILVPRSVTILALSRAAVRKNILIVDMSCSRRSLFSGWKLALRTRVENSALQPNVKLL